MNRVRRHIRTEPHSRVYAVAQWCERVVISNRAMRCLTEVDFKCLQLWPTGRLNFISLWLVQALNMTRRWAFALRPQAHRGYINSSLLESDLKMSESHANVVSFDENVSTLSNLYERNEHCLVNERNNCWKHDNHWYSLQIDDAKPKNLFGQPGQQTSVGRRMYWFQLKY